MSEQEAFERIVTALNGAALDETRWAAAFALIDEALRADVSDAGIRPGFDEIR